ncbi:uncharacterized protein [Dermacentor albipictus]|uniref:uncharacterized protein isoform X3 n=1 Tax=Dermacentor albipictus TaxID=60249 RepID=UPI0038FC9BC7
MSCCTKENQTVVHRILRNPTGIFNTFDKALQFGLPLQDICLDNKLPPRLRELLEVLYVHGSESVHVFGVRPLVSDCVELKSKLECGDTIQWHAYSIYVHAAVFLDEQAPAAVPPGAPAPVAAGAAQGVPGRAAQPHHARAGGPLRGTLDAVATRRQLRRAPGERRARRARHRGPLLRPLPGRRVERRRREGDLRPQAQHPRVGRRGDAGCVRDLHGVPVCRQPREGVEAPGGAAQHDCGRFVAEASAGLPPLHDEDYLYPDWAFRYPEWQLCGEELPAWASRSCFTMDLNSLHDQTTALPPTGPSSAPSAWPRCPGTRGCWCGSSAWGPCHDPWASSPTETGASPGSVASPWTKATSLARTRLAGVSCCAEQVGTWCSLAGVKESIIYVFSVDNFQRPRSEQDGLFREVSRRCQYILDNSDNFRKMGRRVRCVGDLEMLPKDLQRSLAKVDLATADNARTLTVACVAYSSRRQVTRMARRLAQAVKEGQLRSDDITTNLVDDYASLDDGARVQLLLRTSGETRLSDFLLWQSSYARLHFESKNLPEIGFTDYLWALIEYQLQRPQLQAASHASGAATGTSVDRALRQRSFLKRVEAERSANLERLARL